MVVHCVFYHIDDLSTFAMLNIFNGLVHKNQEKTIYLNCNQYIFDEDTLLYAHTVEKIRIPKEHPKRQN
jgi:hypothetical protein